MRRWVIEENPDNCIGPVTIHWSEDKTSNCWIVEETTRKISFEPAPVNRPQIFWTCSDLLSHEHRWKWTAWLCGRWQRIWDRSE